MAHNLSEEEYTKALQEAFNNESTTEELIRSVRKSTSEANIDLIVAICQQEKTK